MANNGVFNIILFNIKNLYLLIQKNFNNIVYFFKYCIYITTESFFNFKNNLLYFYRVILPKINDIKDYTVYNIQNLFCNLLEQFIFLLFKYFVQLLKFCMQIILLTYYFIKKTTDLFLLLLIFLYKNTVLLIKNLYKIFIKKIKYLEKKLLEKTKNKKVIIVLPYIISRIKIYKFVNFFLCNVKTIKYGLYIVNFLEKIINKTICLFYFLYNFFNYQNFLKIILFFIKKIIFIDNKLFNKK